MTMKEKIGLTFDELWKKYNHKVRSFIFTTNNNPKSDIESLLNDTFVLFNQTYEKFDPTKSSLYTYLCTIAKSKLYQEFATKKRSEVFNNSTSIDTYYADNNEGRSNNHYNTNSLDLIDDNEEYDNSIDERFEFVKSTLMSLENKTLYHIFMLKYRGLQLKEIAEILNITENKIKSLLYTKIPKLFDEPKKERFEINEKRKEYYMSNREKIRAYQKQYNLNKKTTN